MRLRAAMAAAVVPALAACASSQSATPASGSSADVQAVALVTNLTPQNYGGGQVSGHARLTPTGRNQYRAEIEIRGAGYQNRMPWAVRTGRCNESGIERGSPLSYPLIETGPDGIGKVTRSVNISIPSGETHSLVIMKSQTERNVIVSCGVLSPAT